MYMHPVDVISMCSADGEIVPLRLRVTDTILGPVKMYIDEVVRHETISHVGTESHLFVCRATLRDETVVLQLRYWVRTHSWSMAIDCQTQM